MKLLVATPAFGGMVTSQYLQSLVMTTAQLVSNGIGFALYTLENESLIPRARNKCAMYALEQGYDRLFFIDADMIFNYEQFRKILDSDKDIIAGTYPVKELPISINYNPLRESDYFGKSNIEENFKNFAKDSADESGEVEVLHVPTGFMSIKCSVLGKLVEDGRVKPYYYREAGSIEPQRAFEFFPCGEHNGEYESEDWAFCRIAREAGFKIYLNTQIVTGHTGNFHYRMSK